MRQYKVNPKHFWIGLGFTAIIATWAAMAVKPEGFTGLGLGIAIGVSLAATVWIYKLWRGDKG